MSEMSSKGLENTNHHPWPSSRIPQGKPTSRLHLRIVLQKTRSRTQMAKPPKNIERPHATIIHIILIICLSLFSLAKSCVSEIDPGTTYFFGIVAYFARNDGRMLTSMMYMLRKRTMAVIKAKAFWWNTGSERKRQHEVLEQNPKEGYCVPCR